jgi:hypothetical protein
VYDPCERIWLSITDRLDRLINDRLDIVTG